MSDSGDDAQARDGEWVVSFSFGCVDSSLEYGGEEIVGCVSARVFQSEVYNADGVLVSDLRIDV